MSKYNYEFDMKYTDNPYIDIIVNCVKILGMNAVVKNENEAMHYEDVRSANAFAKYEKCILGTYNEKKDGYFSYDEYIEWNSYYRMLNGLPPAYTKQEELAYINSVGGDSDNFPDYEQITTNESIIPILWEQYFIDMTPYQDELSDYGIDVTGKYIHELDNDEINIVDTAGVLDEIKETYTATQYRYLYHLGDKRIDFYTARKAVNYALLYLPSLNTFDIIENKFRRLYERNRAYTITTVYSEAYRFMSYHYDAFIMILIILQTMVDMIMEVQEYIINKDVFDSRTIRYLFESYGIEYYKEIPTKYQIRIIKNVNKLLKYKSSNRNITDIIELFDNPDITVYTYYLMKVKKINKSDFKYYTEDDINPKYGTGKIYYLGNPNDLDNNRYPIMESLANVDDEEFKTKYIGDVVSGYTDVLTAYLNSNDWFIGNFPRSNYREQKFSTEDAKKEFIDEFANYFRSIFKDAELPEDLHYNRYNYRAIKYYMCSLLGLFDFSNYDDDKTDDELNALLYSVSDFESGTQNIYDVILLIASINTRSISNTATLFNDSSTLDLTETDPFDLTPYLISYASSLITFAKNYILSDSGLFGDIDSRYVGWIDNGIINELIPEESERVINAELDLRDDTTTAIYKEAEDNDVITSDMIGQEYYTKNYDLTFLKVPILDPNAYKCMDDTSKRVDYDSITYYYKGENVSSGDPFWDGVSTYDILTDEEYDELHQSKKEEILNKEFTIERTKYIAVEAAIDVTKMSYQLSYFMNMLYDKHLDEEDLLVEVDDEISTDSVQLADLLSFVIAMNYLYNGVEPDNIGSDMEKNMTINGFNFDTDWVDIYNYLETKHHIYNNYDKTTDELYDYTYTYKINDGVEVSASVTSGYGMDPMNQQCLVELYDNYLETSPEYKYVYDRDEYYDDTFYAGNKYGEYIGLSSNAEDPKGEPHMRSVNPSDTGTPSEYADLTSVDPNVGAFLSGRYELCEDNGVLGCAYLNEFKELIPTSYKSEDGYNFNFGSSDHWNINLKRHLVYDSDSKSYKTKSEDISWDTQYQSDDNNSHGLWLDTNILTTLQTDDDLSKFNMLKAIYLSNTNLYNHLTYMMRTAESKRMYDIYSILYESFMERENDLKFYELKDINGNPVYEDDDENIYDYTVADIYKIMSYTDDGSGLYIEKEIYGGLEDIPGVFKLAHPIYAVQDVSDSGEISEEVTDYVIERPSISNANTWIFRAVNKASDFIDPVKEEIAVGGVKYVVPMDDITGLLDGNIILEPCKNNIYYSIKTEHIAYLTNRTTKEIILLTDVPDTDTPSSKVGTTTKSINEFHAAVAKTYYEHLQYRNPSLYTRLMELKNDAKYKTLDEKRKRIEELCEYVAVALEKYFDKDEWKYIFNLIPTYNIESVQNYIMKMVIFFKSWKTQMLDIGTGYTIDDPFQNHVQILDDLYYNTDMDNLHDKIRPKEYISTQAMIDDKDKVYISEKYDMDFTIYKEYNINYNFGEKMYGNNFDYPELISKLDIKESISPSEKVEFAYIIYDEEVNDLYE